MREALSKTAPIARDPILHRPGRGRERCALAKAQHEADHEKRGEPAREAGEDRGRRPNYAAQKERKPRPPFVAKPTAEYLEQRIRIGECGKDQPELGIAEAEFTLDRRCCRRDVHSVDIGDEIHQTQQD
jgi:hypothetical protein